MTLTLYFCWLVGDEWAFFQSRLFILNFNEGGLTFKIKFTIIRLKVVLTIRRMMVKQSGKGRGITSAELNAGFHSVILQSAGLSADAVQ